MAELVHQTWSRITGKPWSEARKMGLTDGSYSANIALQKRLLQGFNPFQQPEPPRQEQPQPQPQPEPQRQEPPPPAPPPVDPIAEYNKGIQKLITDWYSYKPATPATFNYSADQEAADKRSVSEQYKPFYQEQATQAGTDFQRSLQVAREGFSRRGLWGAAQGVQTSVDPNTGIATSNIGTSVPTRGPVSGIRQAGEQQLAEAQGQRNTAFNRAFTESVAGGVQQRRAEAQDVYEKTVKQPYEQQYKDWLAQLGNLQGKLK